MHLLVGAALAAFATSTLASPGYLQLDIHKRAPPENRLSRRQKSDGSVDAPLTQNIDKLEYMVNITVGTPPQDLSVTLDTGSSDLWIPGRSSKLCKQGKCDGGSYDPASSSSYTLVQQGGFNITYVAVGDSDAGDWVTDTITVGGSPSIDHQQIGVGFTLADPHGVMGVGYDTNEATNPSPNGVYRTVMDNMKSAGIINRKAYSLYLNDLQASKGAIIFGAVDSTKYSGNLVALPLQPGPQGMVSEFFVTMTSVSFTDGTGRTTQLSPDGYSQSTLLDSGTSNSLLTDEVFSALANGFGAVEFQQGTYLVPCSFADINGTINYSFGGDNGVTIQVPVSQVIGAQEFSPDQFADSSGGCDFGFGSILDSGGFSILGDTFLRSAYAVFDLDNNLAALAQSVDNQTDTSSLAVIPTGTTIPGASITATATGTQLSGAALTEAPNIPMASVKGSSLILPGTPTFDLGSSAPTGGSAATSSSSGIAYVPAVPTAYLLGLGAAMIAL